MSVASFIKSKFDKQKSEVREALFDMLEQPRKSRTPFLVNHPGREEVSCSLIENIDLDSNAIEFIDISPEKNSKAWKKKDALALSSMPIKGKAFVFESVFLEASMSDILKFTVKFPENVLEEDRRDVMRVHMNIEDKVPVNMFVPNGLESSDPISNILPPACQYDAILLDISATGLKAIFPGNLKSIIKEGNILNVRLPLEERDAKIECAYKVSWRYIDQEKFTLVGGEFINLNLAKEAAIQRYVALMQAKHYQRYL